MRRILVLAVLTVGLAVASAPTASAGITGGCEGSVTIAGVAYGPENDSPGNAIFVPDEPALVARWRGSTPGPFKDHHGSVWINVGPFPIAIVDWAGQNDDDEVEKKGMYDIDQIEDKLRFRPTGLYVVEGEHISPDGTCTGLVVVEFEGNPMSTIPGLGALVVTFIGGAMMIGGGRPKTPKTGGA